MLVESGNDTADYFVIEGRRLHAPLHNVLSRTIYLNQIAKTWAFWDGKTLALQYVKHLDRCEHDDQTLLLPKCRAKSRLSIFPVKLTSCVGSRGLLDPLVIGKIVKTFIVMKGPLPAKIKSTCCGCSHYGWGEVNRRV